MEYNIFMQGSVKPVYTYKTWRGLRRRLLALAADTVLGRVEVSFGPQDGVQEGTPVRLFRGPNGYGWETHVNHGIEHDNGLRCSGQSISW